MRNVALPVVGEPGPVHGIWRELAPIVFLWAVPFVVMPMVMQWALHVPNPPGYGRLVLATFIMLSFVSTFAAGVVAWGCILSVIRRNDSRCPLCNEPARGA